MSLNVICLHGFTQNADIMKKKLANLVKPIKNLNLVYMDGTFTLPEKDGIRSLAYWAYDQIDPLNVTWNDHYDESKKIYGLDRSFDEFIKLGQSLGRVDGIIGFSQGGCFADYNCKMHKLGKVPFSLKFAIFISAKIFNRPGYDFDDVQPTIPVFIIYGKSDTVIPPHLTERLAASYANKEIFVHSGLHVVLSMANAKAALKGFMEKIE